RHGRREKETGRLRIRDRKEGGPDDHGLVRPEAPKVVAPRAGLEEVVKVETKDEARERERDVSSRTRPDFLPVAVLLVDVRAGFLAGCAFCALRVARLSEAMRLRVDLLDERDRADVVAPRLSRVHRAGGERSEREKNKKSGHSETAAVRGDQAQPERQEEYRE